MDSTPGSDRHPANGGNQFLKSGLMVGRLPSQRLIWQHSQVCGWGDSDGLEPGSAVRQSLLPSLLCSHWLALWDELQNRSGTQGPQVWLFFPSVLVSFSLIHLWASWGRDWAYHMGDYGQHRGVLKKCWVCENWPTLGGTWEKDSRSVRVWRVLLGPASNVLCVTTRENDLFGFKIKKNLRCKCSYLSCFLTHFLLPQKGKKRKKRG